MENNFFGKRKMERENYHMGLEYQFTTSNKLCKAQPVEYPRIRFTLYSSQ